MILQGDCREVLATLEAESVQTCVTSPPYWGLRDYGVEGQLGLEPTPEEYVTNTVAVFLEVRRVLRPDGLLWLNLGDSYARMQGTNVPQTKNKPVAFPVHTEAGSSDGAVGRGRSPVRRAAAVNLKPKDLVGIPWRVAFALQADGWWLRSAIVWQKPNPMPESVRDRPTSSYEMVFLMAKSETYYYDADAIAEPIQTDPRERYLERARITGRGTQCAAQARGNDRDKSGGFPPRKRSGNKERIPGSERIPGASHVGRGFPWEENNAGTRNARNVWTIPTRPFPEAHFATFPEELARRCILAGSRPGDTVLDPFSGAGTTGLVAQEHHRSYIGIELNPEYIEIAERRLAQNVLPLDGAA